MKNWLFVLFAFVSFTSAIAQGPDCGSAGTLPCNSSISGSTSGTGADGFTTGNNEGTGGQHWYVITASGSGTIQISLCDPNTVYDSRIHVYTGSCGALSFVGQDDDSCLNPGLASDFTWTATNGVTYYIRIGGFGANSGNYQGIVTCNLSISGCTYSVATNYNPSATEDDGSCIFNGGGGNTQGCMDQEACNYCTVCTINDGSCDYSCLGCTYPAATNYDVTATRDDGSCLFPGCTDPTALNYDPAADVDNGNCIIATCLADFDYDGTVGVSDLIFFIGAFGTNCP